MIDQHVTDLAQKRKILAIRQGELERIQDQINRTFGERLEKARQLVKEARTDATEAESALKDTALTLFKDGKIARKPNGAVQIKQWTVLSYDPERAKQHCIKHLPGALTMKKSSFEKVAKVAELDFVDIGKEDRVSISRDLSLWVLSQDDKDCPDCIKALSSGHWLPCPEGKGEDNES